MNAIKRFLVTIFILNLAAGTSASTASSPSFATQQYSINFRIDSVKILGNSGDPFGEGEFRLLIVGADANGRSSGMFCPGYKPIKIRTGETVKSPCLFSLSFDESQVGSNIFLMIMVLDEDKSSLGADLTYELVTQKLGESLGKAAGKSLLKLGSKSAPVFIPISILTSYLSGRVKDWIEKADMIGTQGILLSRSDGWSAGKTKTVESNDGGIQFTYTITRSLTDTSVQSLTSVKPTSSPRTSSSAPAATIKPPQTNNSIGTASISCANRLYVVRLRKSPGYKQKDDTTDTVAEIPCGESVKILDGPTKKDNLNWYQVSWKGKTGWVADYTSTGKLILIFKK